MQCTGNSEKASSGYPAFFSLVSSPCPVCSVVMFPAVCTPLTRCELTDMRPSYSVEAVCTTEFGRVPYAPGEEGSGTNFIVCQQELTHRDRKIVLTPDIYIYNIYIYIYIYNYNII